MKPGYSFFTLLLTIIITAATNNAAAQQYKVQQVTTTMGMKSETTIYVKGMRKRTEGGGYAGMPNNIATIEQCDLRRTISINDKKKLYYIEPFSKEALTGTDNEEKGSTNAKPVATSAASATGKGGTVTMWYNITDTGERKKMYGMTARHVWTTLKMKPSPDACLKDSMIMKTDGWYIDLPQFTCPQQYSTNYATAMGMMDCRDKYVTKQSGKGKLGFPLYEKRTMFMGNGSGETSTVETTLETIEFSTATLDSMLFKVPAGYTLAKSMEELQDKQDFASIRTLYENSDRGESSKTKNSVELKRAGGVRIGVLQPEGAEQLKTAELQAHLVNTIKGHQIDAIAVSSADEAKKYNCQLLLTSTFTQMKQATKLGGVLRAVRNADPTSASAYNIDANLLLSNISDGATRAQKTVSGKFEGTAQSTAKKALEEGSWMLLEELN